MSSIRRQTRQPSPPPSRHVVDSPPKLEKASYRPLLVVYVNDGRITAVGDSYGMRINVDYATRAGTSSKQLPTKAAHLLGTKRKASR